MGHFAVAFCCDRYIFFAGTDEFFLLEPAIRCAGTGHDFFVVTGAYAFLLQSGHFLLDLAIRGAGTGP